ncbi:ankyrin repeat domain-containing protein [Leptospira idonii]|uniref:Ankyrin repeat domain-containing protein n=1 Tax=Leptospira idonii TaxID=1193500 RepID=A0A4V3JXL9_9LEPT|nr:ankyrin repeat domain-containing protein [Leptospira idonii]TGN17398.1 ankyrin repeat domain-containing protein [Leptospira idonii]
MNQRIFTLLIVAALFTSNCKTPLPRIIGEGKTEEAKQRLLDGGDPNDIDCESSLYMAARIGDIDLVKLLLEKGADPNLRSRECVYGSGFLRYRAGNRSPLEKAKTLEIAKLLVNKGANPNFGGFREAFGAAHDETPLLVQIELEQYDIAEFLVKSGASVNIYVTSTGKNIFLQKLDRKEVAGKAGAQKLKALLVSKGAKDLDLSKSASLSLTPVASYTHLTNGESTLMPSNIANALFQDPSKFVPLTMDAKDRRYYHYSEFVINETQMNLHEWLIHRKNQLGQIKK